MYLIFLNTQSDAFVLSWYKWRSNHVRQKQRSKLSKFVGFEYSPIYPLRFLSPSSVLATRKPLEAMQACFVYELSSTYDWKFKLTHWNLIIKQIHINNMWFSQHSYSICYMLCYDNNEYNNSYSHVTFPRQLNEIQEDKIKGHKIRSSCETAAFASPFLSLMPSILRISVPSNHSKWLINKEKLNSPHDLNNN